MQASDIMTEEVHVIQAADSVAHVKNMLVKHRFSVLPVMQDGNIIGVVTERNLSDALYYAHDPIDAIPVFKVMQKEFPMALPTTTPEALAKMMLASNVNAVLIINPEQDEFLGIVTKSDLMKYFITHYPGQATVANLMTKKVITISPFHSVFRAAKEMEKHDISRLVVKDERVVGIVSARDLALASYGLKPEKLVFESKNKDRAVHFRPLIVNDLMRTDVYTILPKSDAVSAAKLMSEKKIGSLVVTDNDELKGIITKKDIVKFLAKN